MASPSAAAAAAATSSIGTILKSSEIRWAVTGWSFFLAENFILSENRTYLIEQLSDDTYHAVYGTFSTIATASIAYGYYRLTKDPSKLALLWKQPTAPVASMLASWMVTTTGLIVASQALPKFQIPVGMGNDENSGTRKLQVRCPFDFADDKNKGSDDKVRGLERISRHPGLWSLGLVGIGNALLQPTLPLCVWWMGPAAIAWLGGSHSDSRFRRGMGGKLDPFYESQTSNVPFTAMLSGKQGSVATTFSELVSQEIKPLNALMAAGVSTIWVVSRGRIRVR